MESEYRFIFIGSGIYNEIDVSESVSLLGIGTVPGSTARFSKSAFNQEFLAVLSRTDSGWHLKCEFGVYLRDKKAPCAELDLKMDDRAVVCSCFSHKELFRVICLRNFQNEITAFETRLNVLDFKKISIGTDSGCNVHFTESGSGREYFELQREANDLRLVPSETSQGIYVNGVRSIGITKIHSRDFIFCGPYCIYFSGLYLYFNHTDGIQFSGMTTEPIWDSRSSLEYPKFNRNTRIREVLSEKELTILDPPEIPQKNNDNLFMTIFPPAAMLVLTFVLRGVMGNNTGMYMLFSVGSMSLGMVTSIMNYKKGKERYTQSLQDRIDTYEKYISRKKDELEQARTEEIDALMRIYPDSSETMQRIADFSGDLFDRTPDDSDFLHIRLGTGSRKAVREISYRPMESLVLGDELQLMPEKLAEEYRYLENAPVVVDLRQAGILGVVGEVADTDRFMRVIIEDMSSRQFSDDATMFAICTEDQLNRHSWMRFFPHFQKKSGLIRNIACDKNSCEIQFEYLFKTLSQRESMTGEHTFPAIIVFVLNQMGLYAHPLSEFLRTAKNYGVYFVFLTENREELPLYCGNLILLQDNNQGVLISTEDKTSETAFTYETVSEEQMTALAEKLAPVYCESISVESSLPKSFSLYALLGIRGADDLDLEYRWKHSDSGKSLAAPMGLKSGNEIVSLDLHEKFHGPHGLVAGTTGSGKSELLQTYILSMATLFPPNEVGFVIIDFKGGGMANLFSDLPHLVGAITDIDGKALNRSLSSIRAELDKRKRLFAQAEVNNIGDYIRKHKSGQECAAQPLPHLILIIDEFAELKADQPEFMKEVISASRVGRSLGIHLILATQKPSGVIDDQIWSNSRFHLCLKVQSKSDSNDVLKSPLAAEIREPGRAYLQVGNNEIFDLFQSAYSGCPAQCEEIDHVKPFKLYEVDSCGRQKLIYSRRTGGSADDAVHVINQLEAITEKIKEYCDSTGVERVSSICMPPLPADLEFSEKTSESMHAKSGIYAELGIYDDPAHQSQNPYTLDLAGNNLLVIGASQSGKSNLLSVMVRSLAEKYSPSDVNLYILDFGPSVLSNFASLPHVGGVVHDNEEEKIKNLFKLLTAETVRRRQKMLDCNISSWSAYRDAGYQDLPLIIVMVDNFTALKELYLTGEDPFLPFCRNGLTVGISIVAASQNLQGIGFRYLASFSQRIALHCNDTMDYSTVIDRCRLFPDAIPGRAVVPIDKEVFEMQIYSSFSGESEKEKVQMQLEFISAQNQKFGKLRAKPIPMIPHDLKLSMIQTENRDHIAIGLDYEGIAPVCLDLTESCAFGIVGKETDESNAVVRNIIAQIQNHPSGAELYIADASRKKLEYLKNSKITVGYSSEEDYLSQIMEKVYDRIQARFLAWKKGEDNIAEQEPLISVVVCGNDPIYNMCKSDDLSRKYTEIVNKYYDMGIFFLFVNIDNADVSSYSGPEILKQLKESKRFIYFDELSDFKMLQVPLTTIRLCGHRQKFDGYCFQGGDAVRFRAAQTDEF